MIIALTVRQFALFEHVELELNKGTTVFTGETGAGKSILVDALSAAFGARANADWVRHGADRAEIIIELDSSDSRLKQILKENDIDDEDFTVIRRVITPEGRSRAWINGTPTSAGILKQFGDICLDLHGQHEHQALLQPHFQKQIIDSRLNSKTKVELQTAFSELSAINKRLKNLNSSRDDAQEQEAWMREESERLLRLDIEENLEDTLVAETEAAHHIEQMQLAAATSIGLLDEAEINIRAMLSQASHLVDGVAAHHPALQEASDLLAQMETLAGETVPYLQAVLDGQWDEESQAQAEDRLAELRAAKRRHHTDEIGLLALLQTWEDKLSALDTASWDEDELRAKQSECMLKYQQLAKSLHEQRIKAASVLIDALRPFLNQLGLANMQLKADIITQEDMHAWQADGSDDITLLAAANLGEPFKRLADTASGGELSRLVLALKGCGALEHEPDTAVFDEVDVGIGGETAWCVGELLKSMGKDRQVFVVSHLPQVASCADHQIAIEKHNVDGRTRTQLQPLDAESRHKEIARMLGGANTESLHHAKQMLSRGQGGSH